MTLPGEIATEPEGLAANSVLLRILATSDLHAHLLPFDYYTDKRAPGTGLARLSALITAGRHGAQNCLLLDNGDTLQGAPLADAALAEFVPAGRVHPMILAMNGLGYDAATLGNHDFDFGLPYLEASMSGAEFPIVLANAARADGTPFLPTRTILRRDVLDGAGICHQLRIGIVGVVPPQVADWNRPQIGSHLVFDDILPAVTREVAALRPDTDIVIVLAHSGLGTLTPGVRQENVARLVSQIDGVDAVVAGHTHRVFPESALRDVTSVPIVQPGALGSHLGCVDLRLVPSDTGDQGWRVTSARVGTFATDTKHPKTRRLLPSRPNLRRQLAADHSATRAFVARPLGACACPLETYFSALAPCAATQLISDAQFDAARPLVAARKDLNHLPLLSAVAPFKSGGRGGAANYTDIPAGPLRLRHAADLYIYPNVLCVVRITGAGMRDWLERAASIFHQIAPNVPDAQPLINHAFAPYNFDRIDGLTYDIDVSQPPRTNPEGDQVNATPPRILDLRFADGRPVTDDDEMLVITNSYRAAGGGHMSAVAAAETIITASDTVRDGIARYIAQSDGPVAPVASQNFRLIGPGTARVIVETGRGALGHPDRLRQFGLAKVSGFGGPDDFTAFEMTL